MPSSPWSPTGVLTIVSLVTLCLLSFVVVLDSDNVVNTQVRDAVYAFPKRDTPLHRRIFHDARAPLPQASDPPTSEAAQPNTPAATPTPVEPSSPPQQAASSPKPATQQQLAPSPAPQPSPAPAPQPQPQPQPPAQSSSPPSAPSPQAPPPSNTPATAAAPPPASSPSSGPVTASDASASLSQNSSSSQSQIKTVSNIDNYSATAFSYSYQPGSITALGGASSTTSSALLNTFGLSTVGAGPTAAASAKGFFANKAGVGVTFGIVGIIVMIALTLAIRMIVKRYRKSRDAKDVDEWFEKYSSGHGSSNWHGDGQYATNNDNGQYGSGSGNRRSAYGVSASDVAATAATTTASLDAYPDRSVHFGGRPNSTASLGVVLPPSLNFAGIGGGGSAQHSPKGSHTSLRNSWTPSQAGVPYAAPANTAYAAAAPRAPHVPYPPAAHGQEQVNFAANGDPYYGTNAAGASAARMGYAQ